jgi:hypothetical protein
MLNQLLMVFGVLCGLLGAALLFGRSPTSDASLLAGGVMLSLGMVLTSISFRAWLGWRQYVKTRETENAEPASNFEPQAVTGQPPIHRSPQERRRSQRILVQVAVLLRIETPNQEHTPTLAFTAWVNAHGGLLESPTKIRAGQKITLIIPLSRKEAVCRVLQVQQLSDDAFATAFEFDRQSPQFWPIACPPLDWSVPCVPSS